MLELKLLGSPQILLAGRPVSGISAVKSQALLFYLAVNGRPQSRLALAGLLWPDKREVDALANLRQALYHLRNALPDSLAINRLTVALNPALPCQVDALLFESEIGETHPLAVRQTAVDRYTGEFLAGFYVDEAEPFDAWAVVLRERLHRLATEALQQLVEHFSEQQESRQGLRYTDQWLALEPWREEAHRAKLQFLAWSGQNQAALAHYERCRKIMAEELGTEPSAEIVALVERIRTKAIRVGAKANEQREFTADAQHTSGSLSIKPEAQVQNFNAGDFTLPAPPTALIGREQTVATIIHRFRTHIGRLLTLVGPPGIGKTRLSLAVALRLQASYRDGVYFIPLAAVTDPTFVASTVLSAFPVTTASTKPPQIRLIEYLRRKELLLVLDNFEQIIAAAPLIAEILLECPGVHILVTSRERLHLRAEQSYHVPALELPSATQLFVQCAQRVNEETVLSAEDLAVVGEICQKLDCLPLAIELSAARLDILSLRQILTRLQERRLDLLTDGPRDLPVYQRALRNAIHRSYTLLHEDEQTLFRALAVFTGGFELEAVVDFSFYEGQVQSLVNKSLVKVETSSHDKRRYWLLATLREYAWEQLVAMGEQAVIQGRHAHYFLKLTEHLQPFGDSSTRQFWLEQIKRNYVNIQAALDWAIQNSEIEITLRFVMPLHTYWLWRGENAERIRWIRVITQLAEQSWAQLEGTNIPLTDPESQKKARLLATALFACGMICDDLAATVHEAQSYWERSLTLSRQCNMTWLLVMNLSEIACHIIHHNEPSAIEYAEARFREAVQFAKSSDTLVKGAVGETYRVWSLLAFQLGHLEQSESLLRQSSQLFTEIGDTVRVEANTGQLGLIAFYQGEIEGARVLYKTCLDSALASGLKGTAIILSHLIGTLEMRCGDWQQAQTRYTNALTLSTEDEFYPQDLGSYLWRIAEFMLCQQKTQVAATLLGASEAIFKAWQYPLPPIYRTEYKQITLAVQAQLDAAAFTLAYNQGHAMTEEAAALYALAVLRKRELA